MQKGFMQYTRTWRYLLLLPLLLLAGGGSSLEE